MRQIGATLDHSNHLLHSSSNIDGISGYFSQVGFMPHGHCYLWRPELIALHALSDTLIGIAYVSISLILYVLIKKVRLQFSAVVLCFGIFIGACGATHFMEVWNLWNPDYWASGLVKAITAVASVGTGIYLFRLRHPIIQMAEAARTAEKHRLDLLSLTENLEKRVAERTEELKATEGKFRDIFGQAPIGIALVSMDGIWITVNPTLCKITGYSEDELVGKTFADITHPEDIKEDWAQAQKLIAGEFASYQMNKRYIHKDGRIIWVKITVTVSRTENGEPNYFVACVEDITLAKQIQTERDRLYELPSHLLCVLDEQSRFISANKGFESVLGYSIQELLGKPIWDFIHPDDLHRSMETEKLGKSTVVHAFVNRLRSKDGSYKWLRWTGTVLDGLNYGAAIDITELKNKEEALNQAVTSANEANNAKSQFLANMSHEIRTPIGAIMGFTDLMAHATSPDEKSDYMKIINRNSQHLLRLVDDILDISKVEAGKLTIEKSNFSLIDFLAEVTTTKSFKAAEKGIGFSLNIEGLIPDQICSDQQRLRQVVTNVAGNAIKFTERGSVQMTVRFNDPRLEFEITDTGEGLTKDQREQIFKPFGQADSSMTRKYGGTGLGLVLSKRLAEALGGDVALKWSEPKKGTCFLAWITPLKVSTAKMVGADSISLSPVIKPTNGHHSALQGLKILLVEDTKDNQALIKTFLKNSGAMVSTADDGLMGVDKAMSEMPDVILMDIQMPNMDGREATRKLRSLGFSKPIIALTAHAMREDRNRCFEAGCTDYISKPIMRDTLIEFLSRYASQKNSSQS